jgi:N-acetylmuramoyl-L-alanine amidase
MKIVDHWLKASAPGEKIQILKSGNARSLIDPDYLIIHYTATDTASEASNWFMNTSNNPDFIAAHIVLDYDGTITQHVPFNRRANHAGTSTWDGVDNMNYHSIGIEIVNPGFVEKLADGSFRRAKTKNYPVSASSKILKADHKHKFWTDKDNHFWFKYPNAQMQALYTLSHLLMNHYQLVTAVGHDDISPARKPDPGPAFNWTAFRNAVFGQASDIGKVFVVNQDASNFRSGASTNNPVLRKLSKGYEVGLIETNGQWCKVYLVDKSAEVLQKQSGVNRSVKTIGWIHASLLDEKAGQ